jgi:FkbM family methyltransferase
VKPVKDFVWRWLTTRMHLSWRLPSGVRAVVRSYVDWCTFNELFASGEYDAAIKATLEEAPRGEPLRVLDLGANVGYFALRCADLALRAGRKVELTLVEGSPSTVRELEERVGPLQELGVACRIVHGLVGARTGSATLSLAREANQNFVGASRDGWSAYRGAVSVPYIDLEQEVTGPLDLLKCDVEGSEFAFLAAYPELLRRTKRAVIEFHPGFGEVARAVEQLRAAGLGEAEVLRQDSLTSVWQFCR